MNSTLAPSSKRLPETKPRPKWARLGEYLITYSLGWIPRPVGVILRRYLYKPIFATWGSSAYIQAGVEFLGAHAIHLGEGVRIFKYTRLNATPGGASIWIGNHVVLERGIELNTVPDYEGCRIEVGDRTYLGPFTCIAGPGSITIGQDCLIAGQVGMYANNHNFSDPDLLIQEQGITRKGICVEDNCWIGAGVKVLDGVTIGRGSVIGANAVVTRDIPPYSVAVGVPARVISKRR